MNFEKQRFDLRMFSYKPFVSASNYDFLSMANQSNLLLRNKVNYKRHFASLVLVENSEDEQSMQQFVKENNNRITLDVPEKVLRTKTLGQFSSGQKISANLGSMART